MFDQKYSIKMFGYSYKVINKKHFGNHNKTYFWLIFLSAYKPFIKKLRLKSILRCVKEEQALLKNNLSQKLLVTVSFKPHKKAYKLSHLGGNFYMKTIF